MPPLTAQEIKSAVKDAIDDRLGEFFIEREKHYQHHQFIESVIGLSNKIKGTACKAVTNLLIAALFALLLFGVVLWGRHQIGGGN